jgi:hypothetical protein
VAGAVEPVLSWPWPTWLGPWVDPALQGLGALLSGLVWLAWAVGLAAALALALLGHLMLSRRARKALS